MDLLFHMLIPVMLAIVAGVEKKKALMLAPVATIPDLDMLLRAHRVYLHTIFIPLATALISFLLKLKQKNPHHNLIILASLYYLSHLLLDVIPGPVAIFWPLTTVGYGLDIGITVSQESFFPTIQPYLSLHVKQIQLPNVVTEGMIATPQSIITCILFFTVIISTYRHKIQHFHTKP